MAGLKLDFNHAVVGIFETQVQKTPHLIVLQEKVRLALDTMLH